MKLKGLEIILAVMLLAVVVSGFAVTWNQASLTSVTPIIGMSADGRIVMAIPSPGGQPQISTNWGQTWAAITNTPPDGTFHQRDIAMSADGTAIIAALAINSSSQPFSVFISTNYGATWTQTLSSNSALVVTCSGDATKLIAAVMNNGPIYYSTNTGVNWYTSSAPNADWVSVASSAGGQHMAAIVTGGKLYFSVDFGATWAPANLPVEFWKSVCLSSDGKWVGATGTGTCISSNSGASWVANNLSGNAVACSANGTNWVIGGSYPQVYTSSDGGVTWVTNVSVVGSYDAAVSADGCEFVVAGPYVWLGRTTPSPQLNIQSTNGNVALSWLVPSTNFVLQQNSDLGTGNWVTVSNTPILNFTNLQEEASVPASASNGFFRLIAQ